jgi:drug/metabolite transporter (DMT)-like permease
MSPRRSILAALGAALLFGASTPFAKLLAGAMSPFMLAGLLYLGSGLGLCGLRLLRGRGFAPSGVRAGEWRWLALAIACGGVLGPVLLMLGLRHTPAAAASLLLNLETVFTAVLAWLLFRENAGAGVVLGMLCIVAGGAVLAWPADASAPSNLLGVAAIAAACLCWGLDNNLTRKAATADALFIAGSKGLVAGSVNLALALSLGARLPPPAFVISALAVGLAGYGLSLVLFILALRGLGAARAGAYFATAPFIGVAIAICAFHEPVSGAFWIAAGLIGFGLWLHLREHHEHLHTHEPLVHSHPHVHDEHHQHAHDGGENVAGLHSHEHVHGVLTHGHAHYPDLHHRHGH